MNTHLPGQGKRVENVNHNFSDSTLSGSKESSYISRFLPNYSHTSAPIYSIIILIKCFITIHFRNQRSISFKPISSHYSLSFIPLIIPRSLFLLPEDFISCSLSTLSITSPLYNDGPNFSHSVVILDGSTLDSQKCSNLVNKLYSRLGYNYWCLQQANTILSISNILIHISSHSVILPYSLPWLFIPKTLP